MQYRAVTEQWPLARPFTIARETMHSLPLAYLEIEHGTVTGRAEAAGVDYRGETPANICAEISAYLDGRVEPPSRAELLADLPAGGARNAIDCALWDWEAKRGGTPTPMYAGMPGPGPLATAFTISLGEPRAMAEAVGLAPEGALLKLKLGGRDGLDIDRVRAVRDAADGARLVVDVNEGWGLEELNRAAPALADLGIELIEQPLPAGDDDELAGYCGPVPLCADESFDTLADLDRMEPYRFVNIKLDKCGGLTAALAIVEAARGRGMGLFVGSMLGTSLGMAPAFLVGQSCDYVDLDGPLLLAGDRDDAMVYEGALIHPPVPALWG